MPGIILKNDTQSTELNDNPTQEEIILGLPIPKKPRVNGVNKELMLLYALQGKQPTEIGELLQCDKGYVSRMLKPVKNYINAYIAHKEDPQALWEFQEFRVLSSVNDEDIKKANLTMKSAFAGTARDKINIFTGKASIDAAGLVFNVISNGDVAIKLNIDMASNDMIDVTPVDNT